MACAWRAESARHSPAVLYIADLGSVAKLATPT
jgi:hypothetical protein